MEYCNGIAYICTQSCLEKTIVSKKEKRHFTRIYVFCLNVFMYLSEKFIRMWVDLGEFRCQHVLITVVLTTLEIH